MTGMIDYLMDDPRQARRLVEKVDADAWVAKYLTQHLAAGQTVLDVGCGPGALVSAAAQAQPEIEMTGVDLSSDRFAEAATRLPRNGRLVRGDARALPFPDNSFDFTYCRFLLEYLADRQEAIRELVRVGKPGGKVMLQDLDGQFLWHYPQDQELSQQLELVFCSAETKGFDPFVGRKLFHFARTAGLANLQVSVESDHLYAGRIDDHNFRLWETKLDIALPIATRILGSQAAAEALKQRMLDYFLSEDTLTYSVLFTVIGTKPF